MSGRPGPGTTRRGGYEQCPATRRSSKRRAARRGSSSRPWARRSPSGTRVWLLATQHRPGLSKHMFEVNNRCFVFRLNDPTAGGPVLVVVNAVDPVVGIPEVRRLEHETGLTVRYILSPGGGHHLMLPAWREQFTQAQVLVGPSASRAPPTASSLRCRSRSIRHRMRPHSASPHSHGLARVRRHHREQSAGGSRPRSTSRRSTRAGRRRCSCRGAKPRRRRWALVRGEQERRGTALRRRRHRRGSRREAIRVVRSPTTTSPSRCSKLRPTWVRERARRTRRSSIRFRRQAGDLRRSAAPRAAAASAATAAAAAARQTAQRRVDRRAATSGFPARAGGGNGYDRCAIVSRASLRT